MTRSGTDARGQSMVEFALILPVFVLILVGVFDLGRAVYAYNTINNAAREAARLAIVDQTIAHIKAEAIGASVALDLGLADIDVDFRSVATPDQADTCSGDVAGDNNNTDAIVLCVAVVTVNYDYQAATPIVGNIIGTLALTGESHFKVDFNCEGSECPLGD